MKQIIYVFTLLVIFSCKEETYKPEGLHLITQEELIEMIHDQRFPVGDNTVIKNEKGEVIPRDSVMQIPNLQEDYTLDMYINDNFELVEMILRPATEDDKRFKERLQNEVKRPKYTESEGVVIDCNKKAEILEEVYKKDQEMRTGNGNIDPEKDRQNVNVVISLIEQCGMPTLTDVNKDQMSAIWLVFQHADNSIRKKYFPLLEKAAENGDLSKSQIAMMKDRILMEEGKPQVYGTQVEQLNGNWELYKLESPETVNMRRAGVGLGPLDEYLRRWEINFNVEQIEE